MLFSKFLAIGSLCLSLRPRYLFTFALGEVEVVWFKTNVLTLGISNNYLCKCITVIWFETILLRLNFGLSGKFVIRLWAKTKIWSHVTCCIHK